MKYSSLSCLVLYFLSATFRIHAAVDKFPNVQCGEPIAATVEVDAPLHRFFPYYIKLHRCQGSWQRISPNIKACVPTAFLEIKIMVHSTVTGKQEEVSVYNHTKCGSDCKASVAKCDYRVQTWNEKTCECDCLFNDSPPPTQVMARKDGFRWNKNLCRYECHRSPAACSRKQKWDGEECSCVCDPFYKRICDSKKKYLNSNTCECTKVTSPVHGRCPADFFTYREARVLVAVLVVAVLVIFVLSGVLIYRCKAAKPAVSQATSTVTVETGSDDCQSRVTNYVSGV